MNYSLKTEKKSEDPDFFSYQENILNDYINKVPLPLLNHTNTKQRIDQENSRIQIALIDSRPLTRSSFSHLLKTKKEFIVFSLSSPSEILTNQIGRYNDGIDLIVFNIGATCISEDQVRNDIYQLKQELPSTPLVIISDHDKPSHILEALSCGIQGYIPTTLSSTVMIQVLHLVWVGGIFIPPDVLFHASKLLESPKEKHLNSSRLESLAGFTPRQVEVLRLLRQGKSNKAIAYELETQESTVKVHVRQIMKKLNATNRTQAALIAQQLFEN